MQVNNSYYVMLSSLEVPDLDEQLLINSIDLITRWAIEYV